MKWKPYPAYKDSGVEWLGKIPVHWKVKRLKYAVHIEAGQSPSSEAVTAGSQGLPFLQGNAEFGAFHPTPHLVCDESPKRAMAGDLLLSVRAPVGALNIADQAYGIGRGLCAIRPGNAFEPRFCYYVLSTVRTRLEAVATGSTYDAVTAAEVGDLPALLPPQFEQRAIAAFLDRETAKIDALVAKKDRLIELLQEKRTALITQAVTKGLDPTVPMKDSGVEWLGRIPAHWELKRIKFIAKVGNGSTPSRENADYWGGEYPWLNSSVVNLREVAEGSDFVTDLALSECHLPRVHPPAVLVAITGEGKTRGMATVLRIEATINQHLAFIRPARTDCDAEYIRYVFHAAYQFLRDESGGGGSTKGALTCDQLGNMWIPFPPDPEQHTIVLFLDKETAKLDALIAKVREGIETLKEYRTALISAAVTGKIDVRETLADSSQANTAS